MSDPLYGNLPIVGYLSIDASKSFQVQETLPDAAYPFGRKYLRETPPNITYTVRYKSVPLAFVLAAQAILQTPGGMFTAKYFYSTKTTANKDYAEVTGYLTAVNATPNEGTSYYDLTIQLMDSSYIAQIGDQA